MMHTGVYLSLRGTVFANNSVISITDIGETEGEINAVQCITDRKPCCRSGVERGQWFFPGGEEVLAQSSTFYQSRGDNDGTINLNRMDNVVLPAGLFCCVVPDAVNVEQTLCVNVGEEQL